MTGAKAVTVEAIGNEAQCFEKPQTVAAVALECFLALASAAVLELARRETKMAGIESG